MFLSHSFSMPKRTVMHRTPSPTRLVWFHVLIESLFLFSLRWRYVSFTFATSLFFFPVFNAIALHQFGFFTFKTARIGWLVSEFTCHELSYDVMSITNHICSVVLIVMFWNELEFLFGHFDLTITPILIWSVLWGSAQSIPTHEFHWAIVSGAL